MSLTERVFESIRIRNPICEIWIREFWYKIPFNNDKWKAYKADGRQGYVINWGGCKPQDKYIILRFSYPIYGICGILNDILFEFKSVEKLGYKLLVDFEGSANYQQRNSWGINIWERYFKTPIRVCDAINAENIRTVTLRCDGFWFENKKLNEFLNGSQKDHSLKYISGEEGIPYRILVRNSAKNFLAFNEAFIQSANKMYHNLFKMKEESCVGVLMREHFSVDYKNSMEDKQHREVLMRHPTTTSVDEVIAEIQKKIEEWNPRYIFLATLYEETVSRFKKLFGDERVFCLERERLDSYKRNEAQFSVKDFNMSFDDMANRYELSSDNLERIDTYMLELFMLSKCDYFITPICSGGFWVPIIKSEEFKEIFYLDNINEN